MKANKGAPGIDGMTVEDFPAHARAHWPAVSKAWFAPSRQRELSESIAARRARLLPDRKALQARLLAK